MVTPSPTGKQPRFTTSTEPEAFVESQEKESPLQPLLRDLRELQMHAGLYVAARADAVRASIRKTLAWTALGLLGGLVGLSIIIAAAGTLVAGMANGFAALFGDRLWAGQLLTGVVILGSVGGAAAWFVSSWMKSSYHRTKEKYERQRTEVQHANGREEPAVY